MIADLDQLPFDNRTTRELPADPAPGPTRRDVHGAAFSHVLPTPADGHPRLLAWSPELAAELGIDPAAFDDPRAAQVLAGARIPAGADPFAAAYGGHQFGHWAGQLGDGRAIALGEVLDPAGRHQLLQLKGAGPTPFSRGADGRAVLRSSLREFLCSEAMHHLGIPTTRALSLALTGDHVVRDVLYDGHPAPEPGAVVCRVAPSFLRFGSYELPAVRGDTDLLRTLVAFTLRTEFPELLAEHGSVDAAIGPWFAEVCERSCALVVDWMRVGFVHGVLNTDNMSVLGLTIDYGPYGWLEGHDPGWTPNTTDAAQRRYRYGAQPQVVQWNLLRLANAIVTLTDDAAPLEAALRAFGPRYEERFAAMRAERLGWGTERAGDGDRWAELEALFARTEVDHAIWFRELARVPLDPRGRLDDAQLLEPLAGAWYAPDEVTGDLAVELAEWLRAWARRVEVGGLDDAERVRVMDAVNPRYVLRNWLAQEAIDAVEAGDDSVLHELLDTLRRPYEVQPGREHAASRRPEWARTRVGCSMLSCSS